MVRKVDEPNGPPGFRQGRGEVGNRGRERIGEADDFVGCEARKDLACEALVTEPMQKIEAPSGSARKRSARVPKPWIEALPFLTTAMTRAGTFSERNSICPAKPTASSSRV